VTHASRRRAHLWGIVAEYLCMLLLISKGYSILERRHRNRMGEIDIIAVRGRIVACIEVKGRTSEASALESVTVQKQQRIARAVSAFIASHARYAQHGLRFDVMVVTSPCKIRHLTDAWRME
jgi:putative endonuclease